MSNRNAPTLDDSTELAPVVLLRILTTGLIVCSYGYLLYLLFGTEWAWVGSGPDSLWELCWAIAVLLYDASIILAVYLDLEGSHGLRIFRQLLRWSLVLILPPTALFGILVVYARDFSFTLIWSVFGILLPLMIWVSLTAVLKSARGQDRKGSRVTLYSGRALKLRLFLPVIVIAAATLVTGLAVRPPAAFEDIPGSIGVFGYGLSILVPQSGDLITVRKPYHRRDWTTGTVIFCMTQRGDLLAGDRFSFHGHYEGRPLYNVAPFDIRAHEVHICQGMSEYASVDNDPVSGQYLVAGYADDKGAVLCLDSSFQLVEDLTNSWNMTDSLGRLTGFPLFFDSLHYLIPRLDRVDIVSTGTDKIRVLARGQFELLSPDKQWLVLRTHSKDGWANFLVNTQTGEPTYLNLAKNWAHHFCFAPDSRYLIYSVSAPDLFETSNRYYIYSIETGVSQKTRLYDAKGAIYWLDTIYSEED